MKLPEQSIIDTFEAGRSTEGWLFNDLYMLYYELGCDKHFLIRLLNNKNPSVVKAAKQIESQEATSLSIEKDPNVIMQKLSLSKGSKICLRGGYTESYSKPFWLGEHEEYQATIIDMISFSEEKSPALVVCLDNVIDLSGHDGYKYKGRYCLLCCNDWFSQRTLSVYVLNEPPNDIASCLAERPRSIEDHASWYSINSHLIG
ncbi:hypothetical protein OLMES_0558 [Oleiphilus messinensis]|uniref:Uncharacterized protein n=1 Tax=Oleiphilus messinensis TaxID=141451 RepID=A0A1Y0I2M8_9GAMM|nr:hypothetical protein [Oleiphilus messinensis]ARU54661.1 hypothetical protein OLMES_0558 [Oleiphilus messinensis]